MARKHRRYGGLNKLTFGALGIPNSSVNTHDVLMGAAAGVGGAFLARFLWNKFATADMKAKAALQSFADGGWPTIVDDNIAVIGAAAAGAGLYFGQKRSNKGLGMAIGAAAGAIAFAKINVDRVAPDAFKGLVAVNVGGRMRGLVLPDQSRQALRGLVMKSPASRAEAGAQWRLPSSAAAGRAQAMAMGVIHRRRAGRG